jgi:hypothetical protein
MTVIVLTFVTLFLAVFTPSLALICRREQSRELQAWDQRQQQHAEADRLAAWHRNRNTRMR